MLRAMVQFGRTSKATWVEFIIYASARRKEPTKSYFGCNFEISIRNFTKNFSFEPLIPRVIMVLFQTSTMKPSRLSTCNPLSVTSCLVTLSLMTLSTTALVSPPVRWLHAPRRAHRETRGAWTRMDAAFSKFAVSSTTKLATRPAWILRLRLSSWHDGHLHCS